MTDKIITQRELPLDQIVDDIELLMRVSISKETVAEYAKAMKDGSVFPPVEVMDVDGELFLTNGFHRLRARKQCNAATILAYVSTGSYEDAQDAAARGDAHSELTLARTNADKNKVVNMLIRMERHMGESARVIAKVAGVHHKIVDKLRKAYENQLSGGAKRQVNPENGNPKPKKVKGLDGKRYRVKPRPAPPPKIAPPPSFGKKYTPEEIGWPAPEIADEEHPDHPGYTRAQWFIFEHGHVHLQPVQERALARRQMALREFSGAVNKLGVAAKEFAKAPPFEVEEYFAVAASMDNGARMWVNKVGQHMDLLLSVLQMLEPFAPALKERTTTAASASNAEGNTTSRAGLPSD